MYVCIAFVLVIDATAQHSQFSNTQSNEIHDWNVAKENISSYWMKKTYDDAAAMRTEAGIDHYIENEVK